MVTVSAVKTVPGFDNQVDFFFTLPVTVTGGDTTDIWVVVEPFGNLFVLESLQIAPAVVRFSFGDGGIVAGTEWQVENQPSNLNLNGATMPVPLDGLVED